MFTTTAETVPGKRRAPTRWSRLATWKKAGLVLTALFVVLSTGLTATGVVLLNRYEGRVQRADLLGPTIRPTSSGDQDTQPINLLLLGSDSREGEPDRSVTGQRSDAIMLVHINKEHDRASIISIPRDSYVSIPPSGDKWVGGMNKINAAFAFGGTPLVARTVTELTGVSLDGALIANFAAVRQLVDAVDGVEVCVPYDVKSSNSGRSWPAGCHHLDGAAADDFTRQRYSVPGGDFGRIYDQQLVIKAIAAKVTTGNIVTSPLRLDELLTAAADALVIDENLDLRKLAMSLHRIRPENVRFATVPYGNPGLQTTAGSAVELDAVRSAELFAAIRDDTVHLWLDANPQPVPGT